MAEAKKPDLDKIVADLHPDVVVEKVHRPHYKARGSYPLKNIDVEDFGGFKKEIIAYVKHHHKKVFGSELPDDMAYAKALQIFQAGGEGARFKGLRQAYDAARDGRLGEVLDDIATGLRHEQEQAYTMGVIHRIDPFDFPTHVEVAKRYIAMAKTVAPKGKYAKPEAIANDYTRLLETQGQLMRAATEPAKAYESKKELKKAA